MNITFDQEYRLENIPPEVRVVGSEPDGALLLRHPTGRVTRLKRDGTTSAVARGVVESLEWKRIDDRFPRLRLERL